MLSVLFHPFPWIHCSSVFIFLVMVYLLLLFYQLYIILLIKSALQIWCNSLWVWPLMLCKLCSTCCCCLVQDTPAEEIFTLSEALSWLNQGLLHVLCITLPTHTIIDIWLCMRVYIWLSTMFWVNPGYLLGILNLMTKPFRFHTVFIHSFSILISGGGKIKAEWKLELIHNRRNASMQRTV